jgi:hypothetical protein
LEFGVPFVQRLYDRCGDIAAQYDGQSAKNLLRERFADAYSTANLSASAAHKQAIIWQPRRLRDRSAIPASQFVMSAFWQRPIALLI